jgi:PAS domain-containing protein
MQDMSEYKQMLGDLKKQEELFRMMVTQSSDVFIIISPDYDITYISPNYSCIAGFLM